MIDLATLTGAKVVALGEESVAVFSNDDDLADAIVAAADESGEQFWHMPLWDSCVPGSIARSPTLPKHVGAPAHLSHRRTLPLEFAEGKRWAHLDIAGAAWAKSAGGYTPKGATGVGVGTLIDLS
ncbi:MAG: hypothetical protein R2849_09370 [Thermomicrobiales bacterium]